MMEVELAGPSAISHYKSIRGKIADGALVYMGSGGAAPAFQGGHFVERGAHPGRWVAPHPPTTLNTNGEVGHFLAVSTPRHSNPPLGAVCVLTQQGHCTHLGVVASAEHHAPGGPASGYQWYRWIYVLAMRPDLKITPDSRAPFSMGGAAYIPHQNCTFAKKDDFRQRVWEGFLGAPNHLLARSPVGVPAPPQVHLAYPLTYP